MSTTADAHPGGQNRAVVLQGRGETRFEEVPCPQPGPGELLLKLRCCGLCGTDLFKISHDPAQAGRVLGHELVGTVVGVGEGVKSFEFGDRVVTPHHVPCGRCHLCWHGNPTLCRVFREDQIAPGGFSEYLLVRARAVQQAARAVPDTMSDEVALFLEPAACVLRSIDRAGVAHRESGEGSTALILGAGSMGLLHLLILRAVDPRSRVILTDPLVDRRNLALRLGATDAVAPDELASRLADSGGEDAADCVFDTVGRPEVLSQAIGCTREGATVVLFAHAEPGEELQVELNTLFKSERRLVGTYSGGPAEQARVWELLTRGWVDPSPLVTHRLPLSCFAQGVELSLRQQALKVVFVPDGEAHSESS